MLFGIPVDGDTVDVFHDDIRRAGLCSAAVQQTRDAQMIQIDENLTLRAKPL